MTFQHISLKFN